MCILIIPIILRSIELCTFPLLESKCDAWKSAQAHARHSWFISILMRSTVKFTACEFYYCWAELGLYCDCAGLAFSHSDNECDVHPVPEHNPSAKKNTHTHCLFHNQLDISCAKFAFFNIFFSSSFRCTKTTINGTINFASHVRCLLATNKSLLVITLNVEHAQWNAKRQFVYTH